MCRNIKTLFNFEPPASDEEIRASALQFVRKLSGTTRPSRANEAAFKRAVDRVSEAAHELLDSLTTSAPPRNREVEAEQVPEEARKVGALLLAGSAEGSHQRPVRVHEVKADKIVLDFNHPLAGHSLNFDVKVVAIE